MSERKKEKDDLLARIRNGGQMTQGEKLRLIVNVNGAVPDRVIGDELRLGQILNNLLSNAVKFTTAGHIGVELSASRTGKGQIELFFMIIDTGIGISDEDKDKLFKSFSQVDGSITRRFGGTGLGLSITKSLVELMGGKISVDSVKDMGSTFSFTVKLKESQGRGALMDFPEGEFDFSEIAPRPARPEGMISVENYGSINSYGTADSTDNSWGNSVKAEIEKPADMIEKENEANTSRMLVREELEKLTICMDLGSWEKAEGFAQSIREKVGQTEPQLKNSAFSLLLNVRKENKETAQKLAEELGKYYGVQQD